MNDKFKQLEGTNLTNGLVITDKTENEEVGNEYVWIEVPSTAVDSTATGGPDYSEVSGEDDCTNIEAALRTYCTKDTSNGNLITVTDGTETTNDYKATTCGFKDEYYDGCGLSDLGAYTTLYNNMLKSIYANGGFWIGRYEAGIESTGIPRRFENDSIDELYPVSKVNSYPINYVSCSQAEEIAEKIENKGSYNSSLMFGIQWDLVIKHLNNKGIETDFLTNDSSIWGNYLDHQFIINRGKYSYTARWNVYVDYTTSITDKVSVENGVSTKIGTTYNNIILLTTGASDTNRMMNIYDLSGNLFEYTLERTPYEGTPCAMRGGRLNWNGVGGPVSYRESCSIYNSYAFNRI